MVLVSRLLLMSYGALRISEMIGVIAQRTGTVIQLSRSSRTSSGLDSAVTHHVSPNRTSSQTLWTTTWVG